MNLKDKIMLTVKEFSTVSGLGEKTIRKLTHIKGFPAIKVGQRVLIHRQTADEWLAEKAVNFKFGSSVLDASITSAVQ